MPDERDEMPPAGPTGYYPDIRGAGPEQGGQIALERIATALEGLLAEIREIRAHLGAPQPGSDRPPPPSWPPGRD
jgi:hypothetical protein